MKRIRTMLAVMLIATMATSVPFETDVSFAKRKTPPSKVYGFKLVKSTKNSVTIKWRKAERARKYIVYSSKGSKGSFVKRFITKRTRFTDYRVKSGTVYRYFVRGYNGRAGKRSRIIKVRFKSSRYVVKRWKIGGNGKNKYDYRKQAWSTVKAVLYSNGLFEIVGKGNIARFSKGSPWYTDKNPKTGKRYNKQIRRVYISKSVRPTSMAFMFSGCTNMRSINRIPYTVENMYAAFEYCHKLVNVPIIPKRVVRMCKTFSNCSSIKTAPTLPKGLFNLERAFMNCTALTEAPEIPQNTKCLAEAFAGCKSLRKAATIKQGNVIESAQKMYKGCKNLRGDMWILGAIKDRAEMAGFFADTATAKGAGLKLRCRISEDDDITGIGNTINRMLDNKSKESKITEKPYFVKVSPVLKSWKIGGDGVTFYNDVTQGTSNVVATLHEDGLLKIEGIGNTAVFYISPPWASEKIGDIYSHEFIKYVYVGRNVKSTNICVWFINCKYLRKINRFPKSTKRMGDVSFNCNSLQTLPAIPKGIKDLSYAFCQSSGLKTAPVLPEGVINLNSAFKDCKNLTKAPAIPKSAEDLIEMFKNCYNLKKGADIPKGNNIKNANSMYAGCKNLTGEIFIHGAIKESAGVNYFFWAAATEAGKKLKVMYSSSAGADVEDTVDRLIATKSPDSNIIKEMF